VASGVPDEPGEGRFGQFDEVIGIQPPVFQPGRPVALDNREPAIGVLAFHVHDQACVTACLLECLGHGGRGVGDEADNRHVGKTGARPKPQGKRRVAGRCFCSCHQGAEPRRPDPCFRVGERSACLGQGSIERRWRRTASHGEVIQ
jgi:hypothetical protein